ncbi:hypothetical protein Taro_038971 [Colocasia esculenta]|uniref:poly(ADP-ribose) glycohydrolase n=1 Tax=Colocasia esculenta TaxID=4460 RepID=A0A843WU97_COLES|nr:hypothetical protein [Colocasia esculenta]
MESRGDLASILPYMPVILRSSSLFWPPNAHEALKGLSLGPDVSGVVSGEVLFDAIVDLRASLGLSRERLAFRAAQGYATFFDELMTREDSRMWFGEVVPGLARLLLRLPSLLEVHYRDSDRAFGAGKAGLRILDRQQAGIVYLSQELIAALLACSFFCLFPVAERSANHLPTINFDHLFSGLHPKGQLSQEAKLKCLIHYFERVCSNIPANFVSYERKVLSVEYSSQCTSYPDVVFWQKSVAPLCSFKVSPSGLIEDQQYDALEADFANEYLGGGALYNGCVQVIVLNFFN